MTLAQWISTVILAVWPMLFAGAFWLFGIPKRQRQALAQFAPIAARVMRGTQSREAAKHLAIAFVADAFKAARLPPLPEEIVSAAIEAELPE